MTETTTAHPLPPAPKPSPETIARLVEQGLDEQRELSERLDAQGRVFLEYARGLEKTIEGVQSRTNAQFLTIAGQLAQTQKHVERIEEHVSLLTKKVAGHDKRFDTLDERFDAHDKRFDTLDKRLDAHDKRFDRIDAQLLTISEGIVALQHTITRQKPQEQ